MITSPRCGKPMRRFEAVNGPMFEEPACGRPAGHPGPCRSAVAVTRMQQADVARIAEHRRSGRYTQVCRKCARRAAGSAA